MDQLPIQGGVETLLVALCYRNQDRLHLDGPLGSYTDLPCCCCHSDLLLHVHLLNRCTFRSSNLNSEDAAAYLERYRKEVQVVANKLAKDRKRQEQKLHQKLTALKQKRIEEKVLCLSSHKKKQVQTCKSFLVGHRHGQGNGGIKYHSS